MLGEMEFLVFGFFIKTYLKNNHHCILTFIEFNEDYEVERKYILNSVLRLVSFGLSVKKYISLQQGLFDLTPELKLVQCGHKQ